jgi:hypothetical protein
MDEDGSMEDAVGVEIEVLDTVILQKPLEEVARWEGQPALHESREHRDFIRIFLHWVWISRGSAPHVDFLLSEKSTVQQRQQVLGLRLRFLPLPVGGAGETLVVLTLRRI